MFAYSGGLLGPACDTAARRRRRPRSARRVCRSRPRGRPLEHGDPVRAHDGRQPVRDHDRRAARQQRPQPSLDRGLGVHVDVRGRLVQHQDARVGDQRPRQRDQLPLPGRQPAAALADLGVVALGQRLDELVRADRLRGRADELELARARAARTRCSRARCRRTGSPPAARRRAAGAGSPASPRAGRGRRRARRRAAGRRSARPASRASTSRRRSRRPAPASRRRGTSSDTSRSAQAGSAPSLRARRVVAEPHVVELDVAADRRPARARPARRCMSGSVSSRSKILSIAAMPCW